MNEKTQQLIKKYVDIVFARKILIVTSVFLALAGGLIQYSRTPKVYQATSLLIYERQAINPTRLMSPDIQARGLEIVNTLQQQVTTRANLEKIIKDLDLYPGLREKIPLEDVIEVMKTNIDIVSPRTGDVFKVSFSGKDPAKVLRVTNALASKFIEENLIYREERASETSNYIANELQLAQQSLDRKEQVMRDYKLKYYNELPEQREINVARATALQSRLQGVQDNIQELERTKLSLQEQIGQRRDMLNSISSDQDAGDGASSLNQVNDPYQQLTRLQAYLNTLIVKYKDTHPEIKRIKKAIAAKEAQIQSGIDAGAGAAGTDAQRSRQSLLNRDPVYQAAVIQQKDIERNLVELRSDERTLKSQIKQLEGWIGAAPIREAEWSALTRDYNQFRQHYDFLVAENLQASSVENLEKKQKGSQFKIMDPARLPQKPIEPDFIKIMVLALGLGFAFGGGIALTLDILDTSFRDPLEIEEYLGLGVTCTVPYLPLKRESNIKRLKLFLFIVYMATGTILLLGAVYFLWNRGIIVF